MSAREELEALSELPQRSALFSAMEVDEIGDWDEPAAAIEGFLSEVELSAEDWISTAAGNPMKITGFVVDKVPPETITSWSMGLVDTMLEWFDQDFGPVEHPTDLSDKEEAALRGKARELVELLLSMGKECRLTKVGEVALGPEAIQELLNVSSGGKRND